MARSLCKLFVCLAPFCLNIFDLVLSLFAIKYTGMEDSSALVIFALAVLAIVAVIYFWSLLKSMKFYYKELLFFSIIIVFFILYMLTGDRYWGNGFQLIQHMRKSVIYCLIYVLSFYVIRREMWFDDFFQVIKWFAITASGIIAFRMLPQMTLDWKAVIYYGTLRYQSMGYLCANVIALLVVYLLNEKKKLPRLLYCILIGTNLTSLLLSGARGAMLAFIAVTAALIIFSLKSVSSALRLFLFALIGAVLLFALSALISNMLYIPDTFADRTFNYVSDGEIHLDNRNDVYLQSIELITKSPVIGYGVGASYYYLGGYPHNIFMEFMIDGGIPYTIFMTLVILYRFFQWLRSFRAHKELGVVFAVILINLVNLLVSGTYYVNAWFYLFIFFNPNINFAKSIPENKNHQYAPGKQHIHEI